MRAHTWEEKCAVTRAPRTQEETQCKCARTYLQVDVLGEAEELDKAGDDAGLDHLLDGRVLLCRAWRQNTMRRGGGTKSVGVMVFENR